MSKATSFGLALLGAGLALALSARAQEPTPSPAVTPPPASTPEPAATPVPAAEPVAMRAGEEAPAPASTPVPGRSLETSASPPRVATLPCGPASTGGFLSRPMVPMPPELQGDVALVSTQAIRVTWGSSTSGLFSKGSSVTKMKPPNFKPFAVKELNLNPITRSAAGETLPFNLAAWLQQYGIQAVGFPAPIALHFEKIRASQEYAFRLVNEDDREAPPVGVRCMWAASATKTDLSGTPVGVEMKVPGPSLVVCELTDARDPEPWRLSLWVGPPSKLVPPEFPSGGELARGAVRYEATSANAAPPGLKSAMILATFFKKEGRAVAAVERNLVPGRVIMQCSTPPAEQPIFVAIGAALYIRDGQALPIEY